MNYINVKNKSKSSRMMKFSDPCGRARMVRRKSNQANRTRANELLKTISRIKAT